MAVDQQRGSGVEARRHGEGIAGVEPDQDKAVPAGAIAIDLGLERTQEGLLELQHGEDLVGRDQRPSGSDGRGSEQDVFVFVAGGGKDGGTTVDLGGIEEIEDGEMLDRKDFVHALKTEAALAVEEVGNVGLLESGLLGETKAGKLSTFDALHKDFTEVLLQGLELHRGEYSTGLRASDLRLYGVSGFGKQERNSKNHPVVQTATRWGPRSASGVI